MKQNLLVHVDITVIFPCFLARRYLVANELLIVFDWNFPQEQIPA